MGLMGIMPMHRLPYLPPTAMRTVSAVSSFSCPFSTYLHTAHGRTSEQVRGSDLITKPWYPCGLYSRTQIPEGHTSRIWIQLGAWTHLMWCGDEKLAKPLM